MSANEQTTSEAAEPPEDEQEPTDRGEHHEMSMTENQEAPEAPVMKANYVQICTGCNVKVTEGQGKVFVMIGDVNLRLHLEPAAAIALGRALRAAALDAEDRANTGSSAASEIDRLKQIATIRTPESLRA